MNTLIALFTVWCTLYQYDGDDDDDEGGGGGGDDGGIFRCWCTWKAVIKHSF